VPVRNYRDLLAWQKAVALAEAVYRASATLPDDERYGLMSQMRRAVVSVSANIAEGEGRRTRGEFLNHLSIAHGSVRELETPVIIACRLEMFSDAASKSLLDMASEVGRLVRGLSNSLER
jgi:four helix bundle protein